MNRRPLLKQFSIIATAGVLAATGPAYAQETLTVEGHQTISSRTRLSSLTIADGATLNALEGQALTLTVDGKGLALVPGTYKGKVELTPTADILVNPMLGGTPNRLRTALYVDGRFVPEKSAVAATGGAIITDTRADNIRLNSADPKFTGIMITGNSSYTLNDPKITLSENGGDDSIGYGAAINIGGDARVTINRARIQTAGVIRTAIFIDGKSDVTVNDSEIETRSGTLPAGYKFSILPGEMMEVPYGLGLSGNVRATNIQGTATVRYNHTHIKAHGWGALATDGAGPAHMFVKDSRIETVGSGYGAYANGESKDVFDHTVFNVHDYGLIIGGPGSATFTNHSVVSSGKYGVMMHQGSGGGTLVIEDGSVFKTRLTAIEVKGRGTTILIDNAQVKPANGILIQTMENDDPIMRDMMRAGPPPIGDPREAATAPSAPPAPAPGADAPVYSGDTIATIRNTTLTGDVVHALPGKALSLTLENARLTGAISTAKARPANGLEPTRETYAEVGNVANTFSPAPAEQKLSVHLGIGADWIVRSTSYVSQLILAEGAKIAAPKGKKLLMSVNGVEIPIAEGSYEGEITLTVSAMKGNTF